MKNDSLTMAVLNKIYGNVDSMLSALKEFPQVGSHVSVKVTSADKKGREVETSLNGSTSSLISMLSNAYLAMTKEEDSDDNRFEKVVRLVLDTLSFTANRLDSEKAFTVAASLHATYTLWKAAMTDTAPQILKDLAKEASCVLTPEDLGLCNENEELEKAFNEAFCKEAN